MCIREGIHHSYFLYADDGLVRSTDLEWLQGAFDTLIGMFDKLGLQTNIGKTVGMVYGTCRASDTQLETAYNIRMTGEGLTYRKSQRVRVKCSECGEEMVLGLLKVHWWTQHGREVGDRWQL